MDDIDVINEIMSVDSLNELTSWIRAQPENDLRRTLLGLFDDVLEYIDANEWATAVRLCEALAIVGWGEREAVDAISRFNGDCWETKFITERNEYRFRFGRWSKRKAGWILWNPEYHFSPDFPDKPDVKWNQLAGVEFQVVEHKKLASQRNYHKQMPITMGQIGGSNRTSNAVSQLKKELTDQLIDTMKPSLYGEAIEKFYLTLHCPALSDSFEAHLKIGAYNAKQKAFYSDLFFDNSFGDLPSRDRREYFAENLLAAIDSLGAKMKKRKIQYDIQAFRSDVIRAIDDWNKQGGS